MHNPKIAFFGSSIFSVLCLEELKTNGILPNLIITTPDMPSGRKLLLNPTPVKTWAKNNNIICLSPIKLDSDFELNISKFDLNIFLVASYGKIIPKHILEIPIFKTLNIHPSLLPRYRGPSPLQEQILNDEANIGVTIMQMDEQIDHGAIIIQEKILTQNWPISFSELENITAITGTKLFIKIIHDWVDGKINSIEQDHSKATLTKKVKKEDGLIDITKGNQYKNFLKILAYNIWPQAYFFIHKKSSDTKGMRIIIKEAEFKNNNLLIKRVLPEGKNEMNYNDFLRGLK